MEQEKTEENVEQMNKEIQENKKEEENKELKEKVSKKLREFKELRCILEISNCTLRFKHNISQIIQERIEKNININTSINNYYTKTNPTTNVFDLGSIINNMFNPYLKNHHIDINKDIEKYEKEKDESEKYNLINKEKKYGIKMKEKLIKKKESNDNNKEQDEGNNKRNRRHHNYYVVDEKKNLPKEKDKIERTMTNCRRKSVLDKIEQEKKEKEKKEKEKEEQKKNDNIINEKNLNNDSEQISGININLDGNKNIDIENESKICYCSNHNKRFLNHEGYISHCRATHKFKCQKCGKFFGIIKKLVNHEASCKNKNIFNNNNSINNNNIEVKINGINNINNINSANQNNNNSDCLINHDVKSNIIKCTECDLIFNNVESMSLHFYKIHEKSKVDEKRIKEEKGQKSLKINDFLKMIRIKVLRNKLKKLNII